MSDSNFKTLISDDLLSISITYLAFIVWSISPNLSYTVMHQNDDRPESTQNTETCSCPVHLRLYGEATGTFWPEQRQFTAGFCFVSFCPIA